MVCFKTRQNLVFCRKRGFLKELFYDKYLTLYTERGIVKHQLSNFSALSWREKDTFPRDDESVLLYTISTTTDRG